MTEHRENHQKDLSEKALLTLMGAIGGYMFIKSFSLSPGSVATFPKYTGAAVLLGSTFLFLQEYMPSGFRNKLPSGIELLDSPKDISDGELDDEIENQEPALDEQENGSSTRYGVDDKIVVSATIITYPTLSYMFGFLWITPIMIGIYLYWFKQPWKIIIPLTIAGFIIPYLFMELVYVRFDIGMVHEWVMG
ncbi:hypothetical protein JCM18237_05510 [Halorubrum luteum]